MKGFDRVFWMLSIVGYAHAGDALWSLQLRCLRAKLKHEEMRESPIVSTGHFKSVVSFL